MDAARWERIQTVFHATANLPVVERSTFLDTACGHDHELLAAVCALLDEDSRGGSLLDRDAAHVAHQLLTPATEALPFTHIGRYAVREELGRGGMGMVYLAERGDLGNLVAIKVLSDAWVSAARRERFQSEQRLLAQLTHRSIARIYDADTLADGTPWFAMEYVKGVPLDAYCREQQYPTGERLRLFREICEAVLYAHQHLVIHRDLKPSNILVADAGAVKLLDFGIAKQLDAIDRPVDQTRTAFRLMTPSYAAPEQVRGEPAGVQTDVYALGVILYELLAGQRPFDLSNRSLREAEVILTEHEAERPSVVCQRSATPMRSMGRAAWADLDVLCLTAMHKDRVRRYASVEALIRDLDHFQKGEPLEARADSLRYRTGKFARRHWRAVAASSTALALVAALVGFYTIRLTAARNVAVAEAGRTDRIQRFMLGLFDAGEQDAAPADDLRVLTLIDRGVKEAQSLVGDPAIQAELRDTLGSLYQRLGKYDLADDLIQRALDQRRALYGGEHADVLESLVSLGLLRVDQAKLDEAERLIRDALDTGRRTLPPGHPNIAKATAALGKALEERGDYKQAIAVLEDAVQLQTASGVPEPQLAATMSALANANFYAGNLDASRSLNERVLGINRRVYGDRHPNVADDLINLGAIESNRGQYPEAERYYREALEIIRAWYGPDHPETASAMTILAQGLGLQRRYAEAAGLLRDAVAIQEHTYGAIHPRVAFALNELGSVALRQKQFDGAESAFSRALAIYRTTYAGRHYRVAVALSNLGSVFLGRGDYPRAEGLLRESVDLHTELLGVDHLNTGIGRIKLGRALLRQRRFKEAEDHLLGGYEILTKQTKPSISWLQMAREDLAIAYDGLAQPEKARRFRDELGAMER